MITDRVRREEHLHKSEKWDRFRQERLRVIDGYIDKKRRSFAAEALLRQIFVTKVWKCLTKNFFLMKGVCKIDSKRSFMKLYNSIKQWRKKQKKYGRDVNKETALKLRYGFTASVSLIS
mmetsp:Transcript_31103/g.47505  ORF Transcript_31103/g.47505 Transcript_31103/m.47505 type:complete len:119 (-) Transcript_31103:776-1132(-)|eukprot:CAMPEP_0170501908 /NCGR_PEP_ID=MMETSP0208-20121228/39830_1 /TAXON_ID=197538 /ORGANISM="Strombidium inclinatum, Strain S3" /LENGTH=118 /DNA_ID=CAMNT_0010780689 /DNA_START=888 /DNA_END=1244 /DNA_ORIENTATION=-